MIWEAMTPPLRTDDLCCHALNMGGTHCSGKPMSLRSTCGHDRGRDFPSVPVELLTYGQHDSGALPLPSRCRCDSASESCSDLFLMRSTIVRLAIGPKTAPDLSYTSWETILAEIFVGDSFGVDRMDYLLRDSHTIFHVFSGLFSSAAAILTDPSERMRDHGSWCGETHIQKAVYFLRELLRVPLGYGFILYKHGPFSFDLRNEITGLWVYELLRLETKPVPYGPSLRPSTNAQKLKRRFPKTLNNYSKRLAFVAEALDGKGVADLERLATAPFVSLTAKDIGRKPGPDTFMT